MVHSVMNALSVWNIEIHEASVVDRAILVCNFEVNHNMGQLAKVIFYLV
jgi:hypothetical protein